MANISDTANCESYSNSDGTEENISSSH